MARLYHKAYRRGGGRKGGFKKASPDPVVYADLPSRQAMPTNSEPSYLGSYTDPWWPTQTVTKITKQESPFPATGGLAIGVIYSRNPPESGGYVLVNRIYPAEVLSSVDYSWVHGDSFTSQNCAYPSRRYPGRLWGKSGGNAGNEFGYWPSMGAASGFVTVYDGDTTYSKVDWPTAGEGVLDYNEEYAVLAAQKASNSTWDIICIRLSDGAVQGTYATSEASPPDSLGMCASGNFVWVLCPSAWGGLSSGQNIFNRAMTHQRNITAIGTAHGDWGLLEDGLTDVHAYVSSSNNAFMYVRADDGTTTTVLNGPSNSVFMWRFNHHLSMQCTERPGYAYVCTFDTNQVSFSTYKAHNSVVAIRLATGEIEPWCCTQHSMSDDQTYNYQAHATPNFKGNRVYFNSSFRRTAAANASSTSSLMYVAERL